MAEIIERNIIINQRINGSWQKLYPKTKASNIFKTDNNVEIPLINNNGKINASYLPDYLYGQLVYGGTVSQDRGANGFTASLTLDAQKKLGYALDTLVLTNDTTDVSGYISNQGIFYIVSYVSVSIDNEGPKVFDITDWQIGDWLIATADGWKKIDNTDAVTSVAGKIGDVTLGVSDIEGLSTALSGKVNIVSGKGLSTNDFTTDLMNKLNGIESGANKTNVDSVITSSSNNPVKSSTIYTALSDKVDKVSGKGLSTNDFTTTLLNKLNGIESGANNYMHPTHTAKAIGFYQVQVDSLGHVINTAEVTKATITALGIPGQDTTYSDATTTTHGLMTAANVITLNNLRSVGSSNPTTATDGDICFITI